MLTAEPTGGVIWHASRGAITLRVRATGREAHVGHVHEGAFEHMIRVAEPLTALSHELLDQEGFYDAVLSYARHRDPDAFANDLEDAVSEEKVPQR